MKKKASLFLLLLFVLSLIFLIANQSSIAADPTGCWDCDYSMLHEEGGFVLCQLGFGEFKHCSTPERDWCMLLDEC